MNIFQKDTLNKEMTCSIDGAYKSPSSYQPTQTVMSYRTERGSDTGRPERNRQVLNRPSRGQVFSSAESKVNFWVTGGTKKMHSES